MLTFEGQQVMGTAAIVAKLTSLPFGTVKCEVESSDVQPSAPGSNGIIVVISGKLLTEGESHPMRFNHVFQLLPNGTAYFIQNEVFRLCYG